MALMVVGPLFGSNAKGTVKGLGTFRSVGQKTSLSHRQFGLIGNDNAPAALKACFATAKATHAEIPPSWVLVNFKWVKRISPPWPEYWNQWLIDNPGCRK